MTHDTSDLVATSDGPSPSDKSISGVPTSITLFVGRTASGPVATAAAGPSASVKSFDEFTSIYGDHLADGTLSYAVREFFAEGGQEAIIARLLRDKNAPLTTSDYLDFFERWFLYKADLFNLLCIPADYSKPGKDIDPLVWSAAANYCLSRRAMLLIDPPVGWADSVNKGDWRGVDMGVFRLYGDASTNAAIYFPRITAGDVVETGDILIPKEPLFLPPCGTVAGIIARTDAALGVWRAPAGLQATAGTDVSPELRLTDEQNGHLALSGINCIRSFAVGGTVLWGALTQAGQGTPGEDFRYMPVRRLALYLEESVYRGTRWAVDEPNAAPLWSSLRLAISTFMQGLKNAGAFFSYFVTCDQTTTTQEDIDNGVVNVVIGFAPVEPAEFLVISIQQMAAYPAGESVPGA